VSRRKREFDCTILPKCWRAGYLQNLPTTLICEYFDPNLYCTTNISNVLTIYLCFTGSLCESQLLNWIVSYSYQVVREFLFFCVVLYHSLEIQNTPTSRKIHFNFLSKVSQNNYSLIDSHRVHEACLLVPSSVKVSDMSPTTATKNMREDSTGVCFFCKKMVKPRSWE